MPSFEPSTWAEVEEAIISNKPSAQTTDPFVLQVRAFTDAPERFLTGARFDQGLGSAPRGAGGADSSHDGPVRPAARALNTMKRNGAQFDDLLGHGRVDLESESFVRRYAVPMNFKHLSMFPQPQASPSPQQPANDDENNNPSSSKDDVTNNNIENNNQSSKSYANSLINPSSKAFNPTVYLSKIHTDSSVDQLQSGATLLTSVLEGLDQRVNASRSDKFIRAALVESAFEATKTSVSHLYHSERDRNRSIAAFRHADASLAATYDAVVQREAKLKRLRRTLTVFKRCQWVFSLGGRLRSAAMRIHEDVKNVEDLVREYQRALTWLRIQRQNDDDIEQATSTSMTTATTTTANASSQQQQQKEKQQQPPPSAIDAIERSIQHGFDVLFQAILTRLSNGHATKFKVSTPATTPTTPSSSSVSSSKQSSTVPAPSSQETARLVSVLISVQREDILAKALTVRTNSVADILQRSIRSLVLLPLSSSLSSTAQASKDTRICTTLVLRLSETFLEGLDYLWSLGRVCQWPIVQFSILRLCQAYAQLVRDRILSDASLTISVEAVRSIATTVRKASELIGHEDQLHPLYEMQTEIVDVFLKALAARVKSDVENLAQQAIRTDSVDTQTVTKVLPIAMSALTLLDPELLRAHTARSAGSPVKQQQHQQQQQQGDSRSQRQRDDDHSHSSLSSPGITPSSCAEMLSMACLETVCVFARKLEHRILRCEYTTQNRVGTTSDDMLRVAVCCNVLEESILPKVMHKACNEKLGRIRTLRYYGRKISDAVKEIGDEGLQRYLKTSIAPIRKTAATLGAILQVQMSAALGEHGDDLLMMNDMTLHGRKQPIRIDGISKTAHELTLQMALVVVNTAHFNASTKIMEFVLMTLIKSIGQTLLDMLSTHKLPYRYAAQLWVDVAFIQQVATTGADLQCIKLLSAIDPFVRIQDRAMQAVVADGFGFTSADTHTLRETVVAAAMNDAKIVTETFEENWTFVQLNCDPSEQQR